MVFLYILFVALLAFTHSIDERAKSKTSVTSPWIDSYCDRPGNEFYTKVPVSFITDPVIYHSVGVCYHGENFEEIVESIVDDLSISSVDSASMSSAIIDVYDLFHARYMISADGLQQLQRKFNDGGFGHCPRSFCRGQRVLPVGLHDELGKSTVKIYCPCCKDVYIPVDVKHRVIDSAAFGTTLPHLFLMKYPQEVEIHLKYIPRIFGFRIEEENFVLQKNSSN